MQIIIGSLVFESLKGRGGLKQNFPYMPIKLHVQIVMLYMSKRTKT